MLFFFFFFSFKPNAKHWSFFNGPLQLPCFPLFWCYLFVEKMVVFKTLSLVSLCVAVCLRCVLCFNLKLCDLNGILKYQLCEGIFPFSFSPSPTIFFSNCNIKSITVSSHNLFLDLVLKDVIN